MTGILSGMIVAFKQIKPEQELSLSSLGLRVKVGYYTSGCSVGYTYAQCTMQNMEHLLSAFVLCMVSFCLTFM